MLAKDASERPTAVEVLHGLNAAGEWLGLAPYAPPEVFPHTSENEQIFWNGWADSYFRFDLLAEALARNDRAYQLAPDNIAVLLTRGNILIGLQRWEEALALYARALAVVPPDDHVRRMNISSNMGVLYNKSKGYAEAEEAYAMALAEMPEAAVIWHNRGNNERQWGLAEHAAGHTREARQHLEQARAHVHQAAKLNPANIPMQGLLAVIEQALATVDS